jgi:hypothetical protein
VLFFPNDQNLRGLIPVVDLVRTAPASVGGRRPVLHFVVSNIPDLDDENEILAERLDKFSDKLGYEEAEFIHHYHSLSLLNQAVFTLERPKTRLAQEYQALTNRIVSGNVEDVEAMLAYLQEVFQDDSRAVYDRLSDVEEHLIRILEAHPNNGEIHFWAARVKRRANFLLDALALVEAAIAKGYVDTQAYTDRLFYLYLLNRRDVAREQATELLTGSNRQYSRRDVAQVLWVAMQLGGFSATTLADSAPVRALGSEDRVSTATVMDDSALALETAGSMAAAVLKQPNVPRKLELEAREIVAQSYLARGELKPALDVLLVDRARDLGFHAAYLIGFASYWAKALDPAPYMRQFVNTPQAATVRSDPYYLQCLAFAHWALGDLALALKCLHQAREHATNLHYRCASTWRFMRVTSEQFAEDCDEMLALFNGEMREPVLMRQGET